VEDNARLPMMLKCKNPDCGFEFASELLTQMELEAFKDATLEAMKERCPKCRQTWVYNKEDYMIKFF